MSRWPLDRGTVGQCDRSPTGHLSSGPGSRQLSQCQKGSRRDCPQSATGQNEPELSADRRKKNKKKIEHNLIKRLQNMQLLFTSDQTAPDNIVLLKVHCCKRIFYCVIPSIHDFFQSMWIIMHRNAYAFEQ